MIAPHIAAIRTRVPDLISDLGATIDQLALAAEIERNPSPRGEVEDGRAIADALVSAGETAMTLRQHADAIARECTLLAGRYPNLSDERSAP
jgi:hypothetical protein